MNYFDNHKIMPRYFAIAIVMSILGVATIGKAFYIMTAKKSYWMQVADRLRKDSVNIKPVRGNILSCDGQLMASSIPEYKIYMDFNVGGIKKDSIWKSKVDSICIGLNKIFTAKAIADFKRDLCEGQRQYNKN